MSPTTHFQVKRVAILGAGVMGAQIAAHFINANVETLLYDLPATKNDLNAHVNQSIQRLSKLKPPPFANDKLINALQPANYQQDLNKLRTCDLIIEAISERFDWKIDLYKTVTAYINDSAIFTTNTSGLSINQLAKVLPQTLQQRFLGMHFFNPPRYMRLVEMIPNANTDSDILSNIETFLVTTLGKIVIHAKDTPNFIANRIGIFSMLAIMHHAMNYQIPLEVVDALTGTVLGRPKSATFRTADVVGLDTLAQVISTMKNNLSNDPWYEYYKIPEWLQTLIDKNALGQKTEIGIYQKKGKDILVYDIDKQHYYEATKKPDPIILDILKIKHPHEKLAQLKNSTHPQAEFLWATFRDLFHYSAYHLTTIAHSVRDVDSALRYGFGWTEGLFQTWQLADWTTVREWIEADLGAHKTLAQASLPEWTREVQEVYKSLGAFAPAEKKYLPRSQLLVYKRQLFPEKFPGETVEYGKTIFENASLRSWHQNDGIAIISFKTKLNTVDDKVLDGIQETLTIAEKNYRGVILWQNQYNDFSAGANLKQMLEVLTEKGPHAIATIIEKFQNTALALRYSHIPTIATIKGRSLGGGCELPMHCDKVVASLETYIGLVEIGVGLLPAGGGTKELALRAANHQNEHQNLHRLEALYQLIVRSDVSTSAKDAIEKNILKPNTVVVFNPDELLYVAKQQIIAMSESGYRPPLSLKIPVAGKNGIAFLKAILVNYLKGGFISEYDYFLATKIASVICGGEVEEGTLVDERWLLTLERETFVDLIQQQKTQQRIAHILSTGKPLRN